MAFLAPAVTALAVVGIAPLLYAAWKSLHYFNLTKRAQERFVGLDNYAYTLTDPVFWQAVGRTALLFIIAVPIEIAFGLTILMTSVHHFVVAQLPFSDGVGRTLGVYRIVPALTLFGTFYVIFLALTPKRYRIIECRKWPGAFVVTVWWLLTVELLPWAIGLFGGYELTYGSLAGVMVVLIFFFVIGLGVVAGAELNAALAEVKPTALKGEVYSGPFKDQLEVEEPQPGEDVELEREKGEPEL